MQAARAGAAAGVGVQGVRLPAADAGQRALVVLRLRVAVGLDPEFRGLMSGFVSVGTGAPGCRVS